MGNSTGKGELGATEGKVECGGDFLSDGVLN